MKITVIIILFQLVFAYAITAAAIQSQTILLRRSGKEVNTQKWPLTKTGKEIERKMMKEPKSLRTPQTRETMIRGELVKHRDIIQDAGKEKARLEEKMAQKKHTLNSFKGKAMSILPGTAEHKLKNALGQIKKSSTAAQNISKDLRYHQNNGHIHDMSGIYQTVTEIQQGGKRRYSNTESASGSGQGSGHARKTSQSLPVSPSTSPTRKPLLGQSHNPSAHVATPARSPLHTQQTRPKSTQSAGPSRSSSPHRSQTPRRGRV